MRTSPSASAWTSRRRYKTCNEGTRTSLDLSIIVPTYREADNLRLLLPGIAEAVKSTRLSYEVLVVDDASDDNPAAAVREAADTCPAELIVRSGRRDLSLAVLEGMRRARGDILLVMDADFSHPPETIPALLEALGRGQTDFAMGSRFVPGGGTEDWGGHRRLNSYVATLLCRPLVGRIRDPMSGFFALRRETFLNAERLDPIGYKIGLELLCRCRCRHVVEVPITFHNRRLGASKLNLEQQRRYLLHLTRLYRDCRPGWGLLVRPLLWAMRAALRILGIPSRLMGRK